MPIGYPGNSVTKTARAKAGGGFESAIEVAPSALENGQSITFTVTGAGSVANPRPVSEDDFSNYSGLSAGTLIPSGADSGAKWLSNSVDQFELATDSTLSGRNFSAKARGKKAHLDRPYESGSGPARSTSTHRTTVWFRFNEAMSAQAFAPGSHKLIRVWDDVNQQRTRFTVESIKTWCTTDNQFTYDTYGATDSLCVALADGTTLNSDPACDAAGTRYRYLDQAACWEQPNQWHLLHAVIYSDSEAAVFIDGKKYPLNAFYKSPDATDIVWQTMLVGHDVNIQSYINDTMRQWLADYKEHNSPALIELSNAEVYDDSTEQYRVPQSASAWSGDEITVPSLFLADLDPDLPIYAHVTKPDGSVVSGSVS